MNLLQIPNLNENPKVIQPTIIGEKSYNFIYEWVDTFCKLDIMYNETYLVKGRAMTTGSDLIGRVKDDNLITGSLYLVNKHGLSVEPTQETLNTDFYLVWEA